jgi:catechol 2,3-dioxygenase-like lactoylglutathione lyase family enzyme
MLMETLNRREALQYLGAFAGPFLARGLAQEPQSAPLLPLHTGGLEHIGMTVPDQEASAKFYGRIFDPQLFKERDPPPRFYVKAGVNYIAFGGPRDAAQKVPASIDHFCAVVQDYKAQDMRKALDDAAIPMTGTGPASMANDPDGLRLQLLGVPGGLAGTIVPASRISLDDPAVQAIGFDHIMLAVTDLEKSAVYYRKFFGPEISRTKKPDRIWFGVAKTRLGLEEVAAGRKPRIDHICVRVAGFDRRVATERLKKLAAEIVPSNDEDLLRFKDPDGIVVELKAGS